MAGENSVGRPRGLFSSPAFVAGAICIVTLATFAGVLGADFVEWDDNWCIYENPGLASLSLESLYGIVCDQTVSSSVYTPLTGLRWCLTYTCCGLNPFGYHLVDWLLHGVNAVLVFVLIRTLLAGKATAECITIGAGAATLVWALHPLRVEPVAWAAAAYGQALMFLLLSLLCYLQGVKPETAPARSLRCMTASVALFAVSLLSKPLGLGFVIVLVVLDVYPLGRLGGGGGWWRQPAARRVLLEKIPFLAVTIAAFLVTAGFHLLAPRGGHGNAPLAEFGVLDRAMQAMYVLAYYVWRPWYPVDLSPVYTTLVSFNPLALPFILSGLAVVAAAAALFLLRHRWPIGLAVGICHLALLAPVLGLLEHPHYPADRYSMLVAIVWSVLLAAWLVSIRNRRLFDGSVACVLVVSVGLAASSVVQAGVWRNSVTLFEHMIRTLGDDPYRSDIHWRLGLAWAERGKPLQAIEQFHRTLDIQPDHTIARDALVAIVRSQGEPGEIIRAYERRLRETPDDVFAHYHVGLICAQQGLAEAALEHFHQVAVLNPTFLTVQRDIVEAHNSLAITCTNKGQLEDAAGHLESALAIKPDFADLHGNLAAVRMLQGRPEEAVAHLRKALDLAHAQGNERLAEKIRRRLNQVPGPRARVEP